MTNFFEISKLGTYLCMFLEYLKIFLIFGMSADF